MKDTMRCFSLVAIVFFVVTLPGTVHARLPEGQAGVVVGRVTDIEGGQLLRYVPEKKDWVVTVKDTPFGLSDTLFSDQDTKAEITVPNGTRMRIAGDTQLQAISLRDTLTEVDVASGEARFYANSESGTVKVTVPFGLVVAPAGTAFDVHIADQVTEVIGLRGNVDFVYANNNQKYPLNAGASSLLADSQQVTFKKLPVDVAWNEWNLKRDGFWSARAEVKGDSHTYLPPNLRDDSYELDQGGRWERVHYQGSYRHFWRPTHVGADWAPFSEGRWTDYYGDNTWVPDEPFGYVTHHYGNWLWVEASNAWYWAPPVVTVGVSFGCPDCWYPGRVAWIFSGVDIGWFPLAPYEPFYCHHWWGRGSIVLRDIYASRINVRLDRFRFYRHAIVLNRNNLFRVRNYSTVRLANVHRNVVLSRFRLAPVLNERMFPNLRATQQKYAFTDVNPTRKPHASVLKHIQRNERLAREVAGETTRSVSKRPVGTNQSQIAGNAETTSMKAPSKSFTRTEVKKHRHEVALPARKTNGAAHETRTLAKRPESRHGTTQSGNPRTGAKTVERRLDGEVSGTPGIRTGRGPETYAHPSVSPPQRERRAARTPGNDGQMRESGGAAHRQVRAHVEARPERVAPQETVQSFGLDHPEPYHRVTKSETPRRTFSGQQPRSSGMSHQQRQTPPESGEHGRPAQAHGHQCRPGVPC
jgi:hypothetical protein